MSTPFIGQILMFGGNFAPVSFAFCNGQTLAIDQNTALYSLLGTVYGGDGVSTFKLPDLQCRLAVHQGQFPGLSNYVLGQAAGSENVSLTQQQIPNHNHPLNATSTNATATQIGGTLLPGQPTDGSPPTFYANPISGQPTLTPFTLAAGTCGMTGNNIPHANQMPSTCVSFIIALQGIFPSRN